MCNPSEDLCRTGVTVSVFLFLTLDPIAFLSKKNKREIYLYLSLDFNNLFYYVYSSISLFLEFKTFNVYNNWTEPPTCTPKRKYPLAPRGQNPMDFYWEIEVILLGQNDYSYSATTYSCLTHYFSTINSNYKLTNQIPQLSGQLGGPMPNVPNLWFTNSPNPSFK